MKWILWLGLVPLITGIKYFWQWAIKDKRDWYLFDETYKKYFLVRVTIAIGLILLGLWLFLGVGDHLSQKYD